MRFLMKNDLNDFGGITTINPTFLEAYNGIVSLKTIEIRGISQDDGTAHPNQDVIHGYSIDIGGQRQIGTCDLGWHSFSGMPFQAIHLEY